MRDEEVVVCLVEKINTRNVCFANVVTNIESPQTHKRRLFVCCLSHTHRKSHFLNIEEEYPL